MGSGHDYVFLEDALHAECAAHYRKLQTERDEQAAKIEVLEKRMGEMYEELNCMDGLEAENKRLRDGLAFISTQSADSMPYLIDQLQCGEEIKSQGATY